MQDVVLHVPAVCKLLVSKCFLALKSILLYMAYAHIAQLDLATRTISSHSRVIVWYWILFKMSYKILSGSFRPFNELDFF
jgi:hypothetical protein